MVVRDVDRRQAERGDEFGKLADHVFAQFAIEVRQWFIKQDQLRFGDDGAGDRDALLLAAGKIARAALREGCQPDALQRPHGACFPIRLRDAAHFKGEGDVAADCQMRPKGIVLEHHTEIALFRRHENLRRSIGNHLAGNADPALGRRKKTGNEAQKSGLAAAGWAEQRQCPSPGERKIDATKNDRLVVMKFQSRCRNGSLDTVRVACHLKIGVSKSCKPE